MEISLQILLGLVAVICFLGGANILLKGANSFLPEGTPPQIVLDNIVRFLSGIYFGMGFLLVWVVLHVPETNDLIYYLGIVVAFSGLGRLYSRIKVGKGGWYLAFIMCFEIALGVAIILLQYYR